MSLLQLELALAAGIAEGRPASPPPQSSQASCHPACPPCGFTPALAAIPRCLLHAWQEKLYLMLLVALQLVSSMGQATGGGPALVTSFQALPTSCRLVWDSSVIRWLREDVSIPAGIPQGSASPPGLLWPNWRWKYCY